MPKKKKIIISGLSLAASALTSYIFAIGLVIGVLATHFFQRKVFRKDTKVLLNFGRRNFHFHHWIMGAGFLLSLWLAGFITIFPTIGLGAAAGIMCHDFLTDKNWHKILIKK